MDNEERMARAMAKVPATAGSLQDVAARDGAGIANALFGAEVVVLVDMSSSMAVRDAPVAGGAPRSRYDAAEEELRKLQADHPGKVGVVGFSTFVYFHLTGVPYRQSGSTKMADALEYVERFDGLYKLVLVSDGEPDSTKRTLEVAKRFKSPIHVIYVGKEDGLRGGWSFLQKLAETTGGTFYIASEPGLLSEGVIPLLTDGVMEL